jgi:hypothetical protein
MRLTILAVFAAFTALGQTQAAKPEPAKVEAVAIAPKLDSTAKLWRLLATAQELQQQLNDSDVGKRLAQVKSDLQAEQTRLAGICSASKGWTLAPQSDGELTCAPVPSTKEEAAKPEAKK